ncbi:hypothetical protein MUG78_10400 [Gordonia alkaliphila]|uniref:hypothetical protein n=1 Tax=Gordonia alkaliphila TaxID=1053547 RepID=UPI001FF6717A|nr:hypothetical protein [Gordonia alkaliphila]MCK0439855.1 hypothetical protein [Gordonia alkaliphila]
MTDVVADAAVWLDRARMADEAAQDLDRLLEAASGTVRRNYFGNGCAEGIALFEELHRILSAWQADMGSLTVGLAATAERCRIAAAQYESADQASGRMVR